MSEKGCEPPSIAHVLVDTASLQTVLFRHQ